MPASIPSPAHYGSDLELLLIQQEFDQELTRRIVDYFVHGSGGFQKLAERLQEHGVNGRQFIALAAAIETMKAEAENWKPTEALRDESPELHQRVSKIYSDLASAVDRLDSLFTQYAI